jgi:ATP-dependent helicase IRC3
MSITLRPYQEEAVNSLISDLKSKDYKHLGLVLATGGGKTVVTAETIKRVLYGLRKVRGATVIFVVHREELVHQTVDTFRALGVSTSRWTSDKKDISGQCIVTMVHSSKALAQTLKDNQRTIILEIVDEGHHYAADSYQRLSYALDAPKTLLVTATPIRTDGMDLGIEKISYQKTFVELVQMGFLAQPDYRIIRITGGNKLRSGGADYKREDLEALDNQDRNIIIAKDFQENREEYGKTLCFCVNIQHAYSLRSAYTSLMPDLKTAVVTQEMTKEQRRSVIEQFEYKDIDVVFNVNIFTEGTDIPSINTIQIARPSKSQVLWSQIVGRGARIHEESNKTSFIIADYADTENNYAWLADGFAQDILGVPPDEELEAERGRQDFLDEANDWLEEIGSKKKLKSQKEVLDIDGIIMMQSKTGKESRMIVRKKHKPIIDSFVEYFKLKPPISGENLMSYVETFLFKDRRGRKWPGKFKLTSLAWCFYIYILVRKGEGKPLAAYRKMPDFNKRD